MDESPTTDIDPLAIGGSTSRSPTQVGLLVVQILIGYEWLVSGLTKLVRGGFPAGLAAELQEKSERLDGWFASFLDEVAVPNAGLLGYLMESGELLIGLAFISAAVLLATVLHLANGATHPWLLPSDAFDEGVDLDSFLVTVQLVLIGVSVAVWRSLRRTS